MADTKLTDLGAVTALAAGDLLYVIDIDVATDSAAGSSRQVTLNNLGGSITNLGTIAGFTSTGIDDNATGTRLLISDTQLTLGVSTGSYQLIHTALDRALIIGRTAANNANITLYGSTHGTFPGDLFLGSGNSVFLAWDESIGKLFLNTGSGTKVTAITIDNAQVTSFVGTAIMPAATTVLSPLRIPHGTAHTSPTDGDIWTTTAGLYVQINGSTVGPLT